MNRLFNSGTGSVAGAFVILVAGAGSLLAGGLRLAPVADATVKKECGACHMAYPAGLLPAQSWRAMMGGLKDHFGENAELDEATTIAITDYLVANAAPADRRGATPTALRITEQGWWTRKHEKRDRTSPRALAKAGAKSKADCKACHDGAEQGVFEDDD
jgi:hypothetical protein